MSSSVRRGNNTGKRRPGNNNNTNNSGPVFNNATGNAYDRTEYSHSTNARRNSDVQMTKATTHGGGAITGGPQNSTAVTNPLKWNINWALQQVDRCHINKAMPQVLWLNLIIAENPTKEVYDQVSEGKDDLRKADHGVEMIERVYKLLQRCE